MSNLPSSRKGNEYRTRTGYIGREYGAFQPKAEAIFTQGKTNPSLLDVKLKKLGLPLKWSKGWDWAGQDVEVDHQMLHQFLTYSNAYGKYGNTYGRINNVKVLLQKSNPENRSQEINKFRDAVGAKAEQFNTESVNQSEPAS